MVMRLTSAHHLALRRHGGYRRSQNIAVLVCLGAAMALIFAPDRGTGFAHVQHLSYVPIIVTAIRFGMLSGASAAVLAVVLYHLANPQTLTWSYEANRRVRAVGIVAAKLADDARQLRQLAMTDDLTGLHNLRSFEIELRTMMRAARAAKAPMSLLVLDVDRLKSLNDEHGHLAGAEAVRTVGRIIAEHIPGDAVACRYGGDEFVIALPQSSPEAAGVADELPCTVLARAPVLAGVHFPAHTLSISIGLASRSFGDAVHTDAAAAADDESEALFRAADAALYAARNGGRNRVHSGHPAT